MSNLQTIAKSMHDLNKQQSDLIKKEKEIDEQAQVKFNELVNGVCDIYNVELDEENTLFNPDLDGSFEIHVLGNLDLQQITEIKDLTEAHDHQEIKEPNSGYSTYIFSFDFEKGWGTEFQ